MLVKTDIYPVGLFFDIKYRTVRRGLMRIAKYPAQGKWRELRSYFNGYLAEHDNHPHNCGRGWTRQGALHDVERLCREQG